MLQFQKLIRPVMVTPSLLGVIVLLHLQVNQTVKVATGASQANSEHQSTNGLTTDQVIAKLLESNRLREAKLLRYSVPSTYRVRSEAGSTRAEAQVVLRFRAPETKEFTIVAESGSGLIRSRVFKPLMDVEVETAAGRYRYNTSVTPNNYIFKLLGEEDIAGTHCFVLEAKAKRVDKYLFNGKIWVHSTDFAIVQIVGKPVKSPSVWIKAVDFVRRFQKIKEFWLPLRNESTTQVRFLGKNTLTVDYDRYEITQVDGTRP